MDNLSILSEIAWFLSGADLAVFAQVSRSFYKASLHPHLWKRESLEAFGSAMMKLSSFDGRGIDWKALFLSGHRVQMTVHRYTSSILSSQEASDFLNELCECLRSPALVIPLLRYERETYPSLFQDLLAHPDDRDFGETSASATLFASRLVLKHSDIAHDLIAASEYEALLSSVAGNQVSSEPQSFALGFMTALRSLLEFHCNLRRCLMQDREGLALLEFYIEQWEVYSHSVVHMESLCRPFAALAARLLSAGRCLDIPLLMRQIWLDTLFYPLQSRLHAAYFETVLNELPGDNSANDSFEKMGLHIAFYDCLVDLALDESSVHQRTQSDLVSEPLAAFHRELCQQLPALDDHALARLETEYALFRWCLLPCGLRHVEQTRLAQIDKLLQERSEGSAGVLPQCKRWLEELLNDDRTLAKYISLV